MNNRPEVITPSPQPSEPNPTPLTEPTDIPPQTTAPAPPIKVKHAHKFIFSYLALLVLVAAVGGYVYERHQGSLAYLTSSSSTQLTIVRDNTLNQPGVSNFTLKVSHASAVDILKDINALKPVRGGPNAVYNCPNDDGVDYTFTFANPTLEATAPATGCDWITVNNDKSYLPTTKFWSDVSKATHQPVDPDTL